MPAFDYIALNPAGRKVQGIMEADSARSIRQQLREKSLVPLEVSEARQQASSTPFFNKLQNRQSLPIAELSLVTRQLATLLQAGMPLETCLQAVAQQSERVGTRRIVLAVRAKVREGHSLADSLRLFPRAFPDLYCASIEAGERAGHLDGVLNQLADYTESQQAFRQKVQLALIYPVILLLLSLLIVTGLMVYVVPDIVQVIVDAGQQLPLLTTLLVKVSDVIANWGIWIALACLLTVAVVRFALQRPNIRFAWHRTLLELWVIKRYSRGSNASRYISTLAILTRSGIPLAEAMPIASSVTANHCFKAATEEAQRNVQEGISLNRALEETGYFPPMMLQLIASGEQSGELADMLQRAAAAQEDDLQRRVSILVGLFEPATLLIMGGIVLTIVLAVLLPILNLNQLVQ